MRRWSDLNLAVWQARMILSQSISQLAECWTDWGHWLKSLALIRMESMGSSQLLYRSLGLKQYLERGEECRLKGDTSADGLNLGIPSLLYRLAGTALAGATKKVKNSKDEKSLLVSFSQFYSFWQSQKSKSQPETSFTCKEPPAKPVGVKSNTILWPMLHGREGQVTE